MSGWMDSGNEWRLARVETRARGFGPNEWISRGIVDLRPCESVQGRLHHWAHENGFRPCDVRLTVIDR